MLRPSEIQNLTTGDFELHLSSVKLRRHDLSKEAESTGTGIVRQSGTGKLHLVMFLTINPPSTLEVFRQHQGQSAAGQLISDDDYYSFEAWDRLGRQWQVARFLPDFTTSAPDDGFPCLGEAWVDEIEGTSNLGMSLAPEDWQVKLWYLGANQFPFTSRITRKKSIGERDLETSSSFSATEFTDRDWRFYVELEGEFLTVQVSSISTTCPEALEYHLEQALEFLMAQRLSWALVERRCGDNIKLLVTDAPRNRKEPRWIRRPVDFRWGSSRAETHAAVDLFRLYLRKILEGEPRAIPSLSVAVRMALEGDGSPLESYGLQVGIAIEKLLQELPLPEPSTDETFRREVTLVQELISRAEISETARARIFGSLARLGGRSAADKLFALTPVSDVKEAEIAAWKSVRHQLAHAGSWKADQTSYDNIRKTMLLFYKVMFYLIGYTGPYRDYGNLGWPWRRLTE
jgi:hypothetical protein